ncbi:PQQ-binding-like beta-propeller repeat protein [Candidatus Eisenbacteria bacterium]|uniref:PQQ-binding-like beta-propeller repeat protein n=1 Tax=Eiseniibacteriota bacterium TaxID=2212470 RepID=A0ABV6YJY5_UNCEI
MKLAAFDGEILWREHTGSSWGLNDRGWSIVIGLDGHPVVTGIFSTPTDPAEYCTVKLDNTDGSEIWRQVLPGAVNHVDSEAGWLAVCDNGDVAMANRTWVTGVSYDVVLHRYAASDGETVWDTQYNSPTSSADDPKEMRRDAAGDLLVVGTSSNDIMVLKFDQENGDLIWSSSYDGPTGGYDSGKSVLEGPNGEILATGASYLTGSSWDVMTVAFDPNDGEPLWDERFASADNQADEGMTMAVSPQGDLFVAGYAYMLTTGSDMLALRYLLDDQSDVRNDPAFPTAPTTILSFSVGPNPSAGDVELFATTTATSHARLVVFDVKGRHLRTLHVGPLDAGEHRWVWEGRDASGVNLGPGVYFATLDAFSSTMVRTVVRIGPSIR